MILLILNMSQMGLKVSTVVIDDKNGGSLTRWFEAAVVTANSILQPDALLISHVQPSVTVLLSLLPKALEYSVSPVVRVGCSDSLQTVVWRLTQLKACPRTLKDSVTCEDRVFSRWFQKFLVLLFSFAL